MSKRNPFDFSDLFKQVDPAEMARQFQELLANSPFGQFDGAALSESQRKNLESIMKANETVISGARALMQRQSEMMGQALSEGAEAMRDLANAEPTEANKKRMDHVERAVKKSMDDFGEIGAMIQDIHGEVAQRVEQRMKENIDELRESLKRPT